MSGKSRPGEKGVGKGGVISFGETNSQANPAGPRRPRADPPPKRRVSPSLGSGGVRRPPDQPPGLLPGPAVDLGARPMAGGGVTLVAGDDRVLKGGGGQSPPPPPQIGEYIAGDGTRKRVRMTREPPPPPSPKREVAYRDVTEVVYASMRDPRVPSWLRSPRSIGPVITAGDRVVEGYIAFKITAATYSGRTLKVDGELAIGPVPVGKTNDWVRKFKDASRRSKEHSPSELLFAAFLMILAVAPSVVPGVVIRATAGSPMSKKEAAQNGYHLWFDEKRSPVRLELDYSLVEQEMADALRYLEAWERKTAIGRWWSLFFMGFRDGGEEEHKRQIVLGQRERARREREAASPSRRAAGSGMKEVLAAAANMARAASSLTAIVFKGELLARSLSAQRDGDRRAWVSMAATRAAGETFMTHEEDDEQQFPTFEGELEPVD